MDMDSLFETMAPEGNSPFKLLVFDEKTEESLHLHPVHWHDYLEIPITIEGSGLALIENHEYSFTGPNVFIINSRELHYIHGNKPYNVNVGYCLQIDLEFFYPLFPELKKRFKVTCNQLLRDKLIEKILLLDRDIKDEKSMYEQTIRVVEILELLSKQESDCAVVASAKYRRRILNITRYIQNNYAQDLTTSDIASRFSLSTGHLQKIFRDQLNQTVFEYISEVRLAHAIDDLKYTDFNILDISMNNGFPNPKSFNNEFKKRLGMTPSQYRKKIR